MEQFFGQKPILGDLSSFFSFCPVPCAPPTCKFILHLSTTLTPYISLSKLAVAARKMWGSASGAGALSASPSSPALHARPCAAKPCQQFSNRSGVFTAVSPSPAAAVFHQRRGVQTVSNAASSAAGFPSDSGDPSQQQQPAPPASSGPPSTSSSGGAAAGSAGAAPATPPQKKSLWQHIKYFFVG